MLKTEFEDRFGKKVTEEQYKDIERVYMASDLMKAEFVNEFKKVSKAGEVSPLLLDITSRFEDRDKDRARLEEMKERLGNWLISLSDRPLNSIEMETALRTKALELLEERAYLKALLDMASPLRDDDRELMKAHI